MIRKKQILSKAYSLCGDVARKIFELPNGGAIKFMDDYELWISANKDSLPTYFWERWEQVHKGLGSSIQKDKQRKEMPEGHEKNKLANEITELRMSFRKLLLNTATLIKQELDSLQDQTDIESL